MLETEHSELKNVNQFDTVKKIVEGLLFASDEPLSLDHIAKILNTEKNSFDNLTEKLSAKEIRTILNLLANDYIERSIELVEVASGFRFQVREELAPYVNKLWVERPQRYSNALLEVLALIAYRQPITRGEIEEIRGVTLSSNIMHTLLEREWIEVISYKEVPGRPALYATTKKFLDHFNLKTLSDLPQLEENFAAGERLPGVQLALPIEENVKDATTSNPDNVTIAQEEK